MAPVRMDGLARPNRLLAALDDGDFATLAPHLALLNLPRGQVVYEAGETIRYTYFPHDAMISLMTVMGDGKSAEMATFGCDSLFGLFGALVSPKSIGRYIVQISGKASRIELDLMQEALRTRPKIQHLVLSFTEALMSQTLQSVACNATHSVEARCCRWILTMHDHWGQDEIPLTHEFLSEMLGVQRSTVSAVTKSLHDAGLIGQSRGAITILNRRALEATACECYEIIRRKFDELLPASRPRRH